MNEAAILAAERNAERIGQQDIDRAFYRTVAGEDAPRSVEPEEKLAIAAHEAGHAVALKALTPESRLKRVSILAASRGMAGYNLSIPKERTVLTQKEMEAQIGVLLAGRAAEVLLGGEKALTSGAAGDLRWAANRRWLPGRWRRPAAAAIPRSRPSAGRSWTRFTKGSPGF